MICWSILYRTKVLLERWQTNKRRKISRKIKLQAAVRGFKPLSPSTETISSIRKNLRPWRLLAGFGLHKSKQSHWSLFKGENTFNTVVFTKPSSDVNEILCVRSGHGEGRFQWVQAGWLKGILSFMQIFQRPQTPIRVVSQILVSTCPQSTNSKFDEILSDKFWGTHLWHFCTSYGSQTSSRTRAARQCNRVDYAVQSLLLLVVVVIV